MKKVTVIIPAFNEEKVIEDCLNSILLQSYKNLEIIVINDGSTDETPNILSRFSTKVKILAQDHLGAGAARNLGAKNARGEILVFVDADMVFDQRFIEILIEPILKGQTIGTFSKDEYVLNKDNIWSKCWNINKGLPTSKMHPDNYPDQQLVFRAILKKEFEKVGGFDLIGYIDDHTLAQKLNTEALNAQGAIFYHNNPETLSEVYNQARWVGKSEYKNRKIKNEFVMKIITIIRYSAPFSLINGLYNAVKFSIPRFVVFKFIYDLAIEVSIFNSFFNEQRYK